MIRAIIVDDELHCRKTLSMLLDEYCPSVQVLEQCNDGISALEAINLVKPDLVFLDIQMPSMDGFQLLEQFSEIPFAVIFTTSHDEYAIRAIRLSALDYLLKPVMAKELIAAVNKVQTQKQLPELEQFRMLLNGISNKKDVLPNIPVPTADGYELIPAEQVMFCEASDNFTYFNLSDKRRVLVCRTLKDVEEQLNSFQFFVRVHNSFIVNIREVKKYVRGEGGYLIMNDDSSVNVSRSRKDALLTWFRSSKQ